MCFHGYSGIHIQHNTQTLMCDADIVPLTQSAHFDVRSSLLSVSLKTNWALHATLRPSYHHVL
jgi:hypothetical protein